MPQGFRIPTPIAVYLMVAALLLTTARAQPFSWSADYAPTLKQGGTIRVTLPEDVTTLNPVLISSAALSMYTGGMYGGPGLLYRDWLGNRQFKDETGAWNTFFASDIEEVLPEQEYIITLRQGWTWSDGEPIDVDDVLAAYTIIGDPEVESNSFFCTQVEDEPVEVEKLGQYQYRLRLPKPTVNALASKSCGTLPEHIYMPAYRQGGADAIKALWGVETDPSAIISGGPYILEEFQLGERMVFVPNPSYGDVVTAADGSRVPGPEKLVVEFVEDSNAELARVVTGQSDYFYPRDLDQLAAINDAISNGTIEGTLFPNIGPGKSLDFITYNFNNSDPCKATMFRAVKFRQAISLLVDRQALVDAALNGAGVPAKDLTTSAGAPFVAPLPELEFNPEQALALLADIGFDTYGDDGILLNPRTGCRLSFALQFNSGNNRRSQEALIISRIAETYGVEITPREVSYTIWADSIAGDLDYDLTGRRKVDYDAQIWSLLGGDIDNPSFYNAFLLQANLNSWNKSKIDVEPWEVLLASLTQQMAQTLELEQRIALYNQRAALMREFLPITPLVSSNFHFYSALGNLWPEEVMDAVTLESPYRPGNFIELLTAP